jgi:hypothetical protein
LWLSGQPQSRKEHEVLFLNQESKRLNSWPACLQASGFGRENYRQFVGSDLRLSAFVPFVA